MNYNINFHEDGGDLGRAEIKPIQPLEFHIILPHIAYILESLHISGNSRLPYKYAFEFPVHTKDLVNLIISSFKLPPHVKFYECDGKKLYEMRGNSGGIVSGIICYLITTDNKEI